MNPRSRFRSAVFVVVAMVAMSALPRPAPASAATGPHLVRNIAVSGASDPRLLTAVGDTLFFSAKGAGGHELWKSDGSEAGTVRVKNIRPGAASSMPNWLTDVNGRLFFRAFDGSQWGLWTSDGSEAGTTPVDYSGTGDSPIVSFLGEAFYVNGDELWRTDGTPTGTHFVDSIASWPNTFITEMVVVGDRLYIVVIEPDGTTDELWISDGTEPGTKVVREINNLSGSGGIHTLTRAGNRLYFLRDTDAFAGAGTNPSDLWTSDGTAAGTKRVKDLYPGPDDYVYNLTAAQGRAFFQADFHQLWKSNGSASSTQLLAALSFQGVSYSHAMTNVSGTLYFVAGDGLWKSDGTPAGTVHVTPFEPYENPFCNPHGPCNFVFRNYSPVGADGHLFYASDQFGTGVELWQTDGTSDGTALVGDVRPGLDSSRPADLTRVGGSVFFTANDGVHGRELWRYVP